MRCLRSLAGTIGSSRVARRVRLAVLACVALSLLAAGAQRASAQDEPLVNPFAFAGVMVDPSGVLRKQLFTDNGNQLTRQRIEAARNGIAKELGERVELRKISLQRLEKSIQETLAAGKPLTEQQRYLGGMTRIRYVFYYPNTKDIVIAGPAEAWAADPSGRVRGIVTGRPVLLLEDLVTALRAFSPDGPSDTVIGCSIDPTRDGLARMQNFLTEVRSQDPLPGPEHIVSGLKQSLGLQKVSVNGIPATTHFAQVLVEADYRMKLIGIGLERTPVKLVSYVDRATPASVARNALQRWFFVPDYKCVRATDDGLSMELVGEGVKLISADEMVAGDGTRAKAGSVDKASREFVQGFTAKYPQLAAASPVYAQLRGLIDMSVAAAFIQQSGFYEKSGWKMPLLGDERQLRVETMTAPQTVETAVASVWKNNQLMTPVGGGVSISAAEALRKENLMKDIEGKVAEAARSVSFEGIKPGQWWWN